MENSKIGLTDQPQELVLAAHSHAAGIVLLRPDRDVEDGSVVG